MIYLSYDPSISNFGWAIGNENEIIDFGHQRTYPKYDLCDRAKKIADTLLEQADKYEAESLIYEYPNKGKYHATGMQTFIKLGIAIGIPLIIKDWKNVYKYTPREWKANRSKEETELSVKSKGFDIKDNNAVDAVALMMFHQRNYNGD